MGKRVKALLYMAGLVYSAAVMALAAEPAWAEEPDGARLEAVYINMPEVTVYGYGLEGAKEAYLGEERLAFQSEMPFAETGEGIRYFILLDISNSMPDQYFQAVKQSIVSLYEQLGGADSAALLTFGEEVHILSEEGAEPEEIEAMLKETANLDNRTSLFDAVSQAAGLDSQKPGGQYRRKVILAISDGEDVAEGKKMSREALDELKEKGIPVYALCISDTDRSNINSFGEFARRSGGDITVFGAEEASFVLPECRKRLMGAVQLEYLAASNQVANDFVTVSLRVPGQEFPLNREALSFRWIPDETFPRIVSVRQLPGRQLELTFDGPVEGSGSATNYILKSGSDVIPIGGVAYAQDKENTVILTTAQAVEAGVYTISCVNITDASMEKNPVTNVVSITLDTREEAPEPAVQPENGDTGLSAVVAILMLFTAAAAAAVAAVYQKMKKNRGVLFVEGRPVLASAVEVKHHVAVEQAQKRPFELLVTVAGKNPRKLQLAMETSLIVGRSQICDLYFDDTRMSRQHFALEWEQNDMYITDLDTTNGTILNGVRLSGKRKLEKGDRICAGAEEMVISW